LAFAKPLANALVALIAEGKNFILSLLQRKAQADTIMQEYSLSWHLLIKRNQLAWEHNSD
jgi:hypothetical protein